MFHVLRDEEDGWTEEDEEEEEEYGRVVTGGGMIGTTSYGLFRSLVLSPCL